MREEPRRVGPDRTQTREQSGLLARLGVGQGEGVTPLGLEFEDATVEHAEALQLAREASGNTQQQRLTRPGTQRGEIQVGVDGLDTDALARQKPAHAVDEPGPIVLGGAELAMKLTRVLLLGGRHAHRGEHPATSEIVADQEVGERGGRRAPS